MCRAASVFFPRLASVEFRPRHDLACGTAVRPCRRVVQCRDRCAVRGAGPGSSASQPRRRRLHRPHRRTPHHAGFVLGGRRSRCLADVRPWVLDADARPARPGPVQGRILAGDLGDGERAAGSAWHPAGAPQRGDEHGTDRRHRGVRISPCRSRISAYIPGAGGHGLGGFLCRHGYQAGAAETSPAQPQPAGRLLAADPPAHHPVFDALRLPLGAAVFAFHLVLPPAARGLRLPRGSVRHPAGAARPRRDSGPG